MSIVCGLLVLFLMMPRKDPRISIEYPVCFSDGWLRGRGVILDLSVSGCRVYSDSAVKKGHMLGMLIEVPLPAVHPLQITRSVVRWIKGQEFGIEFIVMELYDRHRLDELVQCRSLISSQLPPCH